MTEIKKEKSIYELLQEVRYILTQTELKKGGYNAFGKFNYFELEDFLPTVTKLFYERGMCPIFYIKTEADGIEYAHLNIIKGPETAPFMLPTAEATNSSNPIQNAGSKATYMRRYCYAIALELCENDTVDASNNEEIKKPAEGPANKKATENQIEIIKQLYDEENIAKILEYYKIKNLADLSLKQASQVIEKKGK